MCRKSDLGSETVNTALAHPILPLPTHSVADPNTFQIFYKFKSYDIEINCIAVKIVLLGHAGRVRTGGIQSLTPVHLLQHRHFGQVAGLGGDSREGDGRAGPPVCIEDGTFLNGEGDGSQAEDLGRDRL